jgi:phosphatidylserine/phosphatidylglycerophosphate/cardiolipin synthase-like enzyme
MDIDHRDVEDLLDAHLEDLRRPGVLSVRPGYELTNGWLTGRRAVVVTVAKKLQSPPPGQTLPDALGAIPVDVREASPRKRQSLQDPEAYAQERRLAPNHGAVPQFADEQIFVDGAVAPVAVVHPALTLPPKPQLAYTAAPDMPLVAVHAGMTIHLSASPDSGWPTLRAFLGDVSSELTVGIYDFTSRHVLETVRAAVAGKTLQLVIDHPAKNPTADQTDEATVAALRQDLGAGLTQAWALTRMDKLADAWIYPSAYHIKVAVKDHQSMWLSSGNWNNSNQPAIDPVAVAGDAQAARHGDRDWHVVIDHPDLATMFEAYLSHDLTIAAAHQRPRPEPGPPLQPPDPGTTQTPPFAQFFPATTITADMTITPLLTPDPGVYVTNIQQLISSATTTLYLQFQYIELPTTPTTDSQPFQQLIGAVAERQQAGVDVKIIMSEFETAGYLEQLQNVGIDVVHNVKLQNNVHNKGIIVDGHTVLVSSQNWSVAGTLHNRDAGVIIANPDAARYFQQIFLHDWENLTTQTATED